MCTANGGCAKYPFPKLLLWRTLREPRPPSIDQNHRVTKFCCAAGGRVGYPQPSRKGYEHTATRIVPTTLTGWAPGLRKSNKESLFQLRQKNLDLRM